MTEPTETGAARRVAAADERVRRDKDQLDERLDEALSETFPASDPIAVTPSRE